MRLLFIFTGAGYGGVSRQVVAAARFQISQGHTVGVVAAPDERLAGELATAGASFYANSHFVRPFSPAKDLRSPIPVLKAIRAFHPDIISTHSSKAGMVGRICATLSRRVPVLFTAHGWVFSEPVADWKRWLFVLAERAAAAVTTRIICVSEFDRRLALKYRVAPAAKLITIENGVDPVPYDAPRDDSIRTALRIPENATVVTTVARLAPPKDFHTLLDAVRRIRRPIRLLLVGDGELRPDVEREIARCGIADRVLLLGERRNVPAILKASDIFVLSSRKEGMPQAIIEAMFAGLPVVATRVGGVPELVTAGKTGYLVPVGSAAAIADAVDGLADDPELRHRLGDAGRLRARERFTVDRMLRRKAELYSTLSVARERTDVVVL